MTGPDFSRRKRFPGTYGGPFHFLLTTADAVERIPWPVFGLLLFSLAALPSRGSWTRAGVLFFFFLADWALIRCLPHAGRSFGPAKPPALLMALLRIPFAYLPSPWFLLAQASGTALALYAYWVEPMRLEVTRQSLQSGKFPSGPPLRILHIADLHVERITDRERRLQQLIEQENPDLILFSGDLLNLSCVMDPEAWADVRAVIAQWRAPAGVFAVPGSPPVDRPEVLPHIFEGLANIRCLHGEKVVLAHNGAEIDLLGLDCTHIPSQDSSKMRQLLGGRMPARFTILLYHSPDLAPDAASACVDLMLVGHTHGGQVRLPWIGAVYASSLYGKRFEAGRYTIGETTLYVSRGVGMEGRGAPRVRFLCPPEITLWEISAPDTVRP